MAFLKDVKTDIASPIVYTDPKDGDLVINGTAYDIATMMPKMGKNVCQYWDLSSSSSDQTSATFDADSFYRHAPLTDNPSWYSMGTAFSVNYPFCQRSWKDDRVQTEDAWILSYYTRFDMRGRDWVEDPAVIHTYYAPTNRYYTTTDNNDRTQQLTVYDASDNKPIGQENRYAGASAAKVGATYGMTDHGLVGSGASSNSNDFTEGLYRIDFSAEPNLEINTATQLYLQTTNLRDTMCKLTQLDNGDIIISHQSSNSVRVLRYVNSTGAVTVESNRTKSHTITSIPSNVVRHGSSPTQKISYRCRDDTSNVGAMNFEFIQMDVANGNVTVTDIAPTNSGGTGASMTLAEPSPATHVGNYWDTRIISPYGQSHTSEKFVMWWQGSMSLDDQSSQACFNNESSERWINLGVIHSAEGALRWRYTTTWDQLLSDSTRNTNGADKVPWCVAPLNPEHTLMMVFCQYSTHIIKFSVVSGTGTSVELNLEEVWFDENTVFTQAMWLPTGKVITLEWDERFRHGAGEGTIDNAKMALQVWSEDQIYKLDILPDTQYAAYEGSNLSANVGFNAYNANNELLSTSLKVEITGPAEFDNGTSLKTFTTSSSANTVETITITDDGQIEFRVLEVQSI